MIGTALSYLMLVLIVWGVWDGLKESAAKARQPRYQKRRRKWQPLPKHPAPAKEQ